MTEAVTCDFLQRVIKGRYPKDAAPAALRRLLEMLRQIGATPAAKAARPSPSERLTCAYERFLFKERALSQETVTGHRCFVRKFLSEKFGSGPPNLSKLRPLDVTAFVQRHAHQHGPAQARNLVGAMRSFLRLSALQGLGSQGSLAGRSESGMLVVLGWPQTSGARSSTAGSASLRPKHGGGTTRLRHPAFARAAWLAGG